MSERTRPRARLLWFLGLILILGVAGKKVYEAQTHHFLPTSRLVETLERQWSLFKQGIFLPSLPQEFSVQIFEPQFQRTSSFWLDEEFQIELRDFVLDYPGPVLLNLDPQSLLQKETLAPLAKSPRVLRHFSLLHGEDPRSSREVEIFLRKQIEQKTDSHQLARMIALSPAELEYYQSAEGLSGAIGLYVDGGSSATQFISRLPWSFETSFSQVPSLLLAALDRFSFCDRWAFTKSPEIISCLSPEESKRSYVNPLALRFYKEAFPRATTFEEIEKSSKLLLVNPVDRSSEMPSPFGTRLTWSDLMATGIQNVTDNQSPRFTLWSSFVEVSVLLIGFALFWWFSQFSSTRKSLLAALIFFSLFVASDILLSEFLLLYTQPIESFIVLSLSAFLTVGLRAVQEAEERKILERAFSGYLSEERLRRIISGKEKLDLKGRSRSLSFLLLDIAGFSKISKELGPEKTFEFMQRFFSIVDGDILRFEGVIDKKTGDGLLAFFGDYAEGDDPERAARQAIQAGLRIQESLRTSPLSVSLRIGVNSGEAAIGNAGSTKHFNYTVLGDSVNFTQRLEAACPVGEVLVGETTKKLCEQDFQFEAIEISVKNELSKAKAYLVRSV